MSDHEIIDVEPVEPDGDMLPAVRPGANLFFTNDPDEPSIVVLLEGVGVERPEPDAGPEDAGPDAEPDGDAEGDDDRGSGGCGCRAAPAQAGPETLGLVLLLGLFFVMLRGRGRR